MGLEKLIENFILNGRKYIGGLMGFAFGYVLIAHGIAALLIVILTTYVGATLSDGKKIKEIKKIIIDRLKD
ncbi:MAG: hypothetical protein KAH04_06145 [Psychrilyobacter sp.]|nr:hypothetical protein [Psychrilyobacter sp.]